MNRDVFRVLRGRRIRRELESGELQQKIARRLDILWPKRLRELEEPSTGDAFDGATDLGGAGT